MAIPDLDNHSGEERIDKTTMKQQIWLQIELFTCTDYLKEYRDIKTFFALKKHIRKPTQIKELDDLR